MALIALRGDELIGVARYDRWRHRSEAEVAFFVDDANHGRGLATLLLEHLAVRAREVGLTGFTASVLPENRKMIGVFTAAGFEATTQFADGVVEVRLGLVPTPEAEAAIDARARRAAAEAVRRLLSPRSVAVIGASRSPGTIGHELLRNLQRAGFEGPIWPGQPGSRARRVRCGPRRASSTSPSDVDLAVVVVPAESVAAVVEECGRKQVYGVVVLSSGFAEAGPEGAALEAEVLRVARSWGIRLVGPNCLGIINTDPAVRLHATFANVVPLPRSCVAAVGVGHGRRRDHRPGPRGGRRHLVVRGPRQPGRRLGQRPPPVLGGRRPHRRRVPLHRVVRQRPPLQPPGPAAEPDQAGRGREGRTVVTDPTDRAAAAPDRGDPGAHPIAPPRHDTAAHQPTAAGGRRVAIVGNAGGSLADRRRRPPNEPGSSWRALASTWPGEPCTTWACGPGRPTTRHAVAALVRDPGVDAVLAIFAPSLGATPAEARGRPRRRPRPPSRGTCRGLLLRSRSRRGPGWRPDGARLRLCGRRGRGARTGRRLRRAWLSAPEGEPVVLAEDAEAAAARVVVGEALDRGEQILTRSTATTLLGPSASRWSPVRAAATVDEAVAARRGDRLPRRAQGGAAQPRGQDGRGRLRPRPGRRAGASSRVVPHGRPLPGRRHAARPRAADGRPWRRRRRRVVDHPQVGPVPLDPSRRRGRGARPDRGRAGAPARRPRGAAADRRLSPGAGARRRGAIRCSPPRCSRLAALVEEVPEIQVAAPQPGHRRARSGAVLTDVEVEVAEVEREPLPPLRRVDV